MNVKTANVITNANTDDLFNFLSKAENHPEWATEFITDLKKEGNDYKVVTPFGEQFYVVKPDPETKVIDIYVGENKEEMALFPTRVIPLHDGRSAYQFTMFRNPETTPEMFMEQFESLERELSNLKSKFD